MAVSGGTALIICAQAALFPHHFLPKVNPANVALQVGGWSVAGVGGLSGVGRGGSVEGRESPNREQKNHPSGREGGWP